MFYIFYLFIVKTHRFKAALQKIMIIIISLSFTLLDTSNYLRYIYLYIYIYIYIYIYSPMQVYCMRIKLDILIFAILYKELANNIVTICKKLLKCIVLCFMWVYCMNTNKIGYNTVCAMAECYNCLYLSFFINNCLVCIWGNWIINWISGKPWRLWK